MNLFSLDLGSLFVRKGSSETEIGSGDVFILVEVEREGSGPEQALRIMRNGSPLWFNISQETWVDALTLNDIDAPDLFVQDFVLSQNRGLVIDTEGPGEEGWTVQQM